MPKGILRAPDLRKQLKGSDEARDYVNGILENIEDSVHEAVDRNETFAQTEVPVYFPIPYMDATAAQRMIYYYTLKSLEDAEYEPRLILDNPKSAHPRAFIVVTWINSKDIAEKKYMDDYLKSRTVRRSKKI